MNGQEFKMLVDKAKESGRQGVFINLVANVPSTYVPLEDLTFFNSVVGYKSSNKLTYICIDKITSFTFC